MADLSTPLTTLISAEAIHQRLKELGAQITADYQGRRPVLVCVLKGAFVFCADLAREIDLPVYIEFLGVKSYDDATVSSGEVRITHDLTHAVEGRDVIIVEDIVDTGLTGRFLAQLMTARGVASVRLASLLHKPARTQVEMAIDYLGFTIDDHFVVGYGMDVAQAFRNRPDICVYSPPG